MCCLVTTLLLLGPRVATLVWWLVNPTRFNLAFNSVILPVLGFLFLPWTTLMYLAVWSPGQGVQGFDWVWLVIALLIDISADAGGAYGNRGRIFGRRR